VALGLVFVGLATSFVVLVGAGVSWWVEHAGEEVGAVEIAPPTAAAPPSPVAPDGAAPVRSVEEQAHAGPVRPVVSAPPPAPAAISEPVAPTPAPVVLPAPVVAPAPAVAAPPATPSPAPARGGWTVSVLTEAADSAPRVVGTLAAEADVVDARGQAGRPKLLAGCQKSKRWLTLDAGVESVNLVASEAAGMDVPLTAVTVTTASGTDKRKLDVSRQVMANILFRGSDIDELLASPTIEVAYYPFGAAEPVVARFTNEGVAHLTSEMAARCRL
jgi:hypothetical protein